MHKKRWLFVIQNFEVKQFDDCAGLREVIQPILASDYVEAHHICHFQQDYQHWWRPLLTARFNQLSDILNDEPIVIYGAGIHTEQHATDFSHFNVVAIADRNKQLHGTSVLGKPVISPDAISDVARHVIISSKAYEDSIIVDLQALHGDKLVVHPLYQSDDSATIARESYFDSMYQEIRKACSSFQPDIVFFCPTHPSDSLPGHYWSRLRDSFPQQKYAVLWWDYDEESSAGSYLNFERDCLHWADLAIENSNATRLQRMQARQAPYQQHDQADKVVFHPTIFDPSLFYNRQLSPEQLSVDVALFGSKAGARKNWISFLQQQFPEQFQHIGGVSHGQAPLPMADYAKAVSQSKIIVNTQTYPFRAQCKGKVREVLAAGRFLLEEDNPETRAFVPEGKGVIFFKDQQDLADKINYYLQHPDEREAIASAGYTWFEANYSANQWTGQIVRWLGEPQQHIS